MRIATLAALLLLTLAAFAGSRHVHERTESDGSRMSIVIADDGVSHASWSRNGVSYETSDRDVMKALERVMEKHREISAKHREIGRKHREIGREHARIGREHARIGREHARGADEDQLERRQRELEEQQRELEERQEELERVQKELEARQRAVEREVNRELDDIFAKAVREGKARRTN